MKGKSFYKFYYSKDKEIHDLEEVQHEYKKNNGNISNYKGNMFCPECKTAALKFTHRTSKKREFLSKLSTSSHQQDCSYINDYVAKKELKKTSDYLSESQIQDRLEATLNILIPYQKKDLNQSNHISNNNPSEIIINNYKKSSSSTNSIPRKSIGSWFDESEVNKVYIFYGVAKLEVIEVKSKRNGEIFYNLLIKTKKNNEWKLKTKVFRGRKKDLIDTNAVYNIAIYGHLMLYKSYLQINSETPESILYRQK